jgi:hypothetical protein
MDIKQIANSVAAALTAPINYGANINDAAGNAQVTQNIRNLGSLQGQGDIAARATQALGVGADAQDAAEKAAAKQRAQEEQDKADAAQKELDYLNDPKNYKAVVNDVGGYDFYDPSGQKLSAVQYAQATNKHITDLYKDSQDPNDKDFTEDYNRVLQLGKILQSGDKKARDKFYKENPDWKDAYGNTSYNDIVKDLRNEYSGYFRSDQELTRKDKFGGSSLNKVGADTRSTKQKVLDLLNPRR